MKNNFAGIAKCDTFQKAPWRFFPLRFYRAWFINACPPEAGLHFQMCNATILDAQGRP